MERNAVHTSNAPAAIGPYSQAVRVGDTVYVSGQIPIDPATGEFAGADIRTQTRQCLKNLGNILQEFWLFLIIWTFMTLLQYNIQQMT